MRRSWFWSASGVGRIWRPGAGGAVRWMKAMMSVGVFWSSGDMSPPGTPITHTTSAEAVIQTVSAAAESCEKQWMAVVAPRSMPFAARASATRRASCWLPARIAAMPVAGAPDEWPSRPGSDFPSRSKAATSTGWQPSGSMISSLSPAPMRTAVTAPPVTR